MGDGLSLKVTYEINADDSALGQAAVQNLLGRVPLGAKADQPPAISGGVPLAYKPPIAQLPDRAPLALSPAPVEPPKLISPPRPTSGLVRTSRTVPHQESFFEGYEDDSREVPQVEEGIIEAPSKQAPSKQDSKGWLSALACGVPIACLVLFLFTLGIRFKESQESKTAEAKASQVEPVVGETCTDRKGNHYALYSEGCDIYPKTVESNLPKEEASTEEKTEEPVQSGSSDEPTTLLQLLERK